MKKPGYKSVIEYYMVPYFRNLKELNSWRRRVEFSLPGVGGGETGRCSKGTKFHSPREISSGDLIYNKLIFNIYLYCLWDFYLKSFFFILEICGVPIVAQQKQIRLGIMRLQVRSLDLLSGLRIWCCRELWCRLQTWLGSLHCCGCGVARQL